MKNNNGMTLIELVLSIIIISICFIPVGIIYNQALAKIYRSRVMTAASGLAEEKMDQVLGSAFAGVANAGPTAFSSPFADYSYQVIVHYVDAADLNTSVDPAVTQYKNVEVRITHTQIGTLKMISLLSNYTA